MAIFFIFIVILAGSNANIVLLGPRETAQIVGEQVQFDCDLTDIDATSKAVPVGKPYTITWTFRALDQDAVSTVMTAIHQGNEKFTILSPAPDKYQDTQSPRLVVHNLVLSDAGWYACSSNLTKEVVGANLLVVGHPKCHNEKADVYFRENISLECTVSYGGIRHPFVDWRFGSLKLNSTSETEENSTSLKERLVLQASDKVRGHIYHCNVHYPGLISVECLALPAIQVYSPAEVIAVHVFPVTRHNDFPLGTNVVLKCISRGFPVPTYSWTFIPAGSDKNTEMLAFSSQFTIDSFAEEHAGTYVCHVTNEILVKASGPGSYDNLETFLNSRNVTLTVAETVDVEGPNAAYIVGGSSSGQVGPQVADTSMRYSYRARPNTSLFSPYAIGAVISAGLAVLLIIVFVFMAMRMKKREKRMREKIARAHDENLDDQEVELLDESTQPNTEYLPTEYSRLKMSWEIPRKDVRLLEQIAQGAFVQVWKGRMRRSPGSTDVMRVIIKKLQGEASDKERHFFTAELEVLKMLPAHANVIRLVGSYTANEPWLMMMELASEGTLQQFLQRHCPGHQQVMIGRGEKPSVSLTKKQTLTSQKLLALAAQVASGLDHLEKFKLVYYRLRSCKILVAKGGICKLSGFGFPNEMTERNVYEANSVPVRWTAPESLQSNVYNTKTDTWSYGIVAWEILHFGSTPYPTMGPHEVIESVQNGFRMPKPQHCSSELYELLLRCWHTIPEERPSYQEILEVLSHLVVNADVHIDFSSLPDHLLSLDTADSSAF